MKSTRLMACVAASILVASACGGNNENNDITFDNNGTSDMGADATNTNNGVDPDMGGEDPDMAVDPDMTEMRCTPGIKELVVVESQNEGQKP